MGKINVLIDGGSGTGKTTVAKELQRLGYHAINSDEICYNGDPVTGEPVTTHSHDTWIWDAQKLTDLLASDNEVTFICGGSRNRDQFIDRFDRVFELIIDEKTLRHRIATRPGNGWGKRAEELELILQIHHNDPNRPKGAIEIDAVRPLVHVVDEILRKTKQAKPAQ